MQLETINKLVLQSLAMANNYLYTGRPNKAIEVIAQVNKVDPSNYLASAIMLNAVDLVTSNDEAQSEFGRHWLGESLDDRSIEIFCDQGMGDTINCLRYVQALKSRWNCRVILNCCAYHKELEGLIKRVPCVDQFTSTHIRCDYHTNILSLGTILNGIKLGVHYPGHWQLLLDTEIPPSPEFGQFDRAFDGPGFRVGLAYRSNADSPLAVKKSVPIQYFAMLEDGVNELYSIAPDEERYNLMVQLPLPSLLETAMYMASLDAVVTVDTVTLHLAGVLGKKTLAILPYEADARWALGLRTVWYPTVELFRQPADFDWEVPMRQIKDRLVSLRSML